MNEGNMPQLENSDGAQPVTKEVIDAQPQTQELVDAEIQYRKEKIIAKIAKNEDLTVEEIGFADRNGIVVSPDMRDRATKIAAGVLTPKI